MKSLQEIKSILSHHKQDLYNEYPIKSMAIFGSYSRQENHTNSDLDLLVEFNGKIGIRFVDLAEELEKLIGSKVDLVSKNGINKKYLEAIDSELIYV
jgi:predicted nucleotidyltransferase